MTTVILLCLSVMVALSLGWLLARKLNARERDEHRLFFAWFIDSLQRDGHRMYLPVVDKLEGHLSTIYGANWRQPEETQS